MYPEHHAVRVPVRSLGQSSTLTSMAQSVNDLGQGTGCIPTAQSSVVQSFQNQWGVEYDPTETSIFIVGPLLDGSTGVYGSETQQAIQQLLGSSFPACSSSTPPQGGGNGGGTPTCPSGSTWNGNGCVTSGTPTTPTTSSGSNAGLAVGALVVGGAIAAGAYAMSRRGKAMARERH